MFQLMDRNVKWRSCIQSALAAVLLSMSLVAGSANAQNVGRTKVRLVAIGEGASIRVAGSATIPAGAVTTRDRRLAVLFSLSGDGRSERFQVALNYRHRFAVTHPTKLIGVLELHARVSENGQPVGATVVRTVTVADPLSAGSTAGSGTDSPPSQPSPAPEKPLTAERPPEKARVIPCSPATMPALKPGMGIVTGSFHLDGGAPPGEEVCTGATVTVTTLKGEVVVTAEVGSTESYAIAIPAGTYLVKAVATDVGGSGPPLTLLSEEISVSAGETVETRRVVFPIA